MQRTPMAAKARSHAARALKVAPVTLAIRSALAASVALALAGPAAAAPARGVADVRAVHDLTRIAAGHVPPIVVSGGGDAHVENADDIAVSEVYANAIGIDVQVTGDTVVANGGAITATSTYGLADGIFATATNVDVANSGDIAAHGYSWAAGIEAQGDVATTVANTGNIDALVSGSGQAFAIYATGGAGGVSVSNSGLLNANGYYATGIEVAAGGDADIVNDGAINAGTDGAAVATGIHATSQYDAGAVTIVNRGDIVASAAFIATGIEAAASGAGGTVEITNDGVVNAFTSYNYTTTGIAASADGNATVTNAGSVYAAGGGDSDGIVATTFGGTASVVNAGDVTAVSSQGYANGLVADAAGGVAAITNTGSVQAYSSYVGIGVHAQGYLGTTVDNDGSIFSYATFAYGIHALSGQGDIAITNGEDGSVVAYGALGVGAFGVATQGDVALDNAGLVAGVGVSQLGLGAFLRANAGDVEVDNSGSLQGVSNDDATALRAIADAGDVRIVNSGAVGAVAGAGRASGIGATARNAVSIANGGTIEATSYAGDAYAVSASAATVGIVNAGDILASASQGNGLGVFGRGDAVSITNTGAIDASGLAGIGVYAAGTTSVALLNAGTIDVAGTYAQGALAVSDGRVAIENRGAVNAAGDARALGFGLEAHGDASVLNTGAIRVDSADDARGVQAFGYAALTLENRAGSIQVSGANAAAGLIASAYGAATVINGAALTVRSGDGSASGIVATGASTVGVRNGAALTVDGATDATGIVAYGDGATSVLNTGTLAITSADGEATGVVAGSGTGLAIENRGRITATGGAGAAAVDFAGAGTLLNTGSLQAVSDGIALAVRGDAGIQDIRNGGTILSGIATGAGNDRFTNLAGGTWFVDDAATDFGSGDDVLANSAGATITFRGGTIGLGDSTSGNTFDNLGTLRVQGTGRIDMGTASGVPAASARAFSNGGLIDMVDGATDDVLTVQGNFGGSGRLAIDLAMDGSSVDRLVVNGNVAAGTRQMVDVRFSGLPTSSIAPKAFATVTGTSTADAFVAGNVMGYDPRDFLDLRVTVRSDQSTSNATPDVFYVGLDVAGLNAAGSLAANMTAGAQSMLAAQIGSWRDRMGLNPSLDGRVGLGGWARTFADRGRVSPTNTGVTMGSAGDLRFDQHSHGHEVGMDAHLGRGVHAGLMVGEIDGTQALLDGSGTDRQHAGTSGVYASWFGGNGAYLDVSYRWLSFDARLHTAAGLQNARGDGHAFNVEAGLGGWMLGGFRAVPQVQFTESRVGRLDVRGVQTTFVAGGSTSRRGRVGLEFSRDIALGAASLTPYAALGAVREFDGRSRYSVGGLFNGETSTKGTSATADLGLAAQYRGVVVGAGVHWTDGGALQDFAGGQLVLRYTW